MPSSSVFNLSLPNFTLSNIPSRFFLSNTFFFHFLMSRSFSLKLYPHFLPIFHSSKSVLLRFLPPSLLRSPSSSFPIPRTHSTPWAFLWTHSHGAGRGVVAGGLTSSAKTAGVRNLRDPMVFISVHVEETPSRQPFSWDLRLLFQTKCESFPRMQSTLLLFFPRGGSRFMPLNEIGSAISVDLRLCSNFELKAHWDRLIGVTCINLDFCPYSNQRSGCNKRNKFLILFVIYASLYSMHLCIKSRIGVCSNYLAICSCVYACICLCMCVCMNVCAWT